MTGPVLKKSTVVLNFRTSVSGLGCVLVTVSFYELYVHTYRKQMQQLLWWDMIHTKSESATNMFSHANTQRQCSADQEHALHRYMLARPLQARATCPRTWWTRPTHPEPPSMPPPTHRHQFLVLVLVPVLNTPRLWLCGLSSEECRSLREIRVYHRSQPGQASMGTESVCAKSE